MITNVAVCFVLLIAKQNLLNLGRKQTNLATFCETALFICVFISIMVAAFALIGTHRWAKTIAVIALTLMNVMSLIGFLVGWIPFHL
jgi:hypothetical protein